MKRSYRLVLACHCVLNQGAVVVGEARAPGVLPEALAWLQAQGWGILQLPCPEFTFLGPDRPPMDVEGYDTPAYVAHCASILVPVLDQAEAYAAAGFSLEGVMTIRSSPSCDPGRGVFLRTLLAEAEKRGLSLGPLFSVPDTADGRFDPEDPDCLPRGRGR